MVAVAPGNDNRSQFRIPHAPTQTGFPRTGPQVRGHWANASVSPGGSPTFSTRRNSLRRPLIRSAGWAPRVPIKVGAIPTLIIADARAVCVSGACGSSPSRYRSDASGVPAANVHALSSLGPGNHCGGTVFTAPRVQAAAIAVNRRSTAVRTSGVFSSVRPISARQPGVGDHLGKRLGAPQPVHHHRQARPLLRTATHQHHLARRSENPGQVGDRGRHRLSREERQLTHEIDTRPAAHPRGVTGPHDAATEHRKGKTPTYPSRGRAGVSLRSSLGVRWA